MLCPKCKSDNIKIELVRGSAFMAVVVFLILTPISLLLFALGIPSLIQVIFFWYAPYAMDETFVFVNTLLGIILAVLILALNIYISYKIYRRKEYILCQSCGQSTKVNRNNVNQKQKQKG